MIMQRVLRLIYRLPPPVLGRLRGLNRFRWLRKLNVVRRYDTHGRILSAARYVLIDPELSNFTYDLANGAELAGFVAGSVGVPHPDADRFVREGQEDEELRRMLRSRLAGRWDRKQRAQYGRRLGWYAIARALKPRLIVETGIHDGLGSALLLRALERNASEGSPGRLMSVDVDPAAGWLVDHRLRSGWEPIYESTFTALPRALDGEEVGMIVHDSDHTYECELFEFETAVAHAAPRLALVSDNSHATSALRDVCESLGIDYRFFREQPRDHFYPGGGIGFGLLVRGS